jgi:hypothetical protein
MHMRRAPAEPFHFNRRCAKFTVRRPQPCFNFRVKREAKVWLLIASMVVGGLVSAVQGHSATDAFLESAKTAPVRPCETTKTVSCTIPLSEGALHLKR